MPTELGRLIRARRRELDIGLREFARRIGKSPSFVATLEKDQRQPSASEKTLRKIAAELGLDADTVIRLGGKIPTDVLPRSDREIALYREVKRMDDEDQAELLRKLRESGKSEGSR